MPVVIRLFRYPQPAENNSKEKKKSEEKTKEKTKEKIKRSSVRHKGNRKGGDSADPDESNALEKSSNFSE